MYLASVQTDCLAPTATGRLGVLIIHFFSKSQVCTSGCHLKGESTSQACRSYMIVNVIVKDRQNFFFHFMIPPSAGGLPGQFVLA